MVNILHNLKDTDKFCLWAWLMCFKSLVIHSFPKAGNPHMKKLLLEYHQTQKKTEDNLSLLI